jgi:integrase
VPRQRTERCNGPYKDGTRWRVVEHGADGSRSALSFASKGEAQAYVDAYRRLAAGAEEVGQAVTQYLEHLQERGTHRASTLVTLGYRLRAFFRTPERQRMVSSLTPAAVADLYRRRTEKVRADTHRGELAAATAFLDWCVRKRYLRSNPAAGVEPIGQKAQGKDQHRISEARRFLGHALEAAQAGDLAALAALTAMLQGMRASEVTDLNVRDVDDGATVIWVTRGKTRSAVRQLEIAEPLQPLFAKLVLGRRGEDRLFGDVDRHWLRHHVQRLCREAKVPEITTHALRGMHATIRVRAGLTAAEVAAVLGQADTGATARRHYIAPGAEQQAQSRAAMKLLQGGRR